MLASARWSLLLPLAFTLGCSSSSSSPLPEVTPEGPGASDRKDAGADSSAPKPRFPPGKELDPGLSWEGFPKGETEPSTIRLADYHDEDGSKGIHALLLTQDAFSCAFSSTATQEIQARYPGWEASGIELVQLVVYDNRTGKDEPADIESARRWKEQYDASWSVGADPDFTFHEIGHNPLPIQIVVDPRTLTVVARANANDHRLLTDLEELAERNRK